MGTFVSFTFARVSDIYDAKAEVQLAAYSPTDSAATPPSQSSLLNVVLHMTRGPLGFRCYAILSLPFLVHTRSSPASQTPSLVDMLSTFSMGEHWEAPRVSTSCCTLEGWLRSTTRGAKQGDGAGVTMSCFLYSRILNGVLWRTQGPKQV